MYADNFNQNTLPTPTVDPDFILLWVQRGFPDIIVTKKFNQLYVEPVSSGWFQAGSLCNLLVPIFTKDKFNSISDLPAQEERRITWAVINSSWFYELRQDRGYFPHIWRKMYSLN